MTVCELIKILRQDLLDDNVNELLWDDAALLRIINEAQRQSCSRGDYLFDLITFPITANTEYYVLDSTITRIVRILLDGKEIHRKTRHEMDDRKRGWRTATQGDPVAIISGRSLRFSPVSTSDASCTLEVYRIPKLLEDCDQELEITPEYHADLVHWCLYRCLSKRDVDTYDIQKAREELAVFDSIFGKVVPATVRQHQLEGEHAAIIRPFSYTSKSNCNEAW